jgi:CheY-like chemotaxis protein
MTQTPGILLIETDLDAPGLTERVLRRYRIDNLLEKATDGDSAIALLRKGFADHVQLALLDYSAAGMPALETLVRIRSMPGLDQLPIIVSCGSPEEERMVREWNTRRTASMSKPPGFFKLLECIQKLEMHWFVFGGKPE